MKSPKFYLIINSGFWMCGKHGYSRKRDAVEFMEKWQKTMIMSGLNADVVFDAIKVEKA